MTIRVLLADDHPAVLEKVAELLQGTCEIVGSVGDGRSLLEAAARRKPDVIVLDISMPVMNGFEAAEHLMRERTRARIVFLTVHDDPDFVKAALETGASGYILKSRMATDLVPAIQGALAGDCYISPSQAGEQPRAQF